MKYSIEKIPEKQRFQIQKVVQLIHAWARNDIQVEMILLYGSYARWDFTIKEVIQECGVISEYKSDFDFLVITRKPTQEKNMRISQEISQEIQKEPTIETPVSIIIEDIGHVNARIKEGRYFYLELLKESIVLFDSWKCILHHLTDSDTRDISSLKREDFFMWMKWGDEFFEWYRYFLEREYLSAAAFLLHQSIERYITAYLLVESWYKPKTHDIHILYSKMCSHDSCFHSIFKDTSPNDFDFLRRTYIESRYSKTFTVTQEQLNYFEERAIHLRTLVDEKCKKILSL